MSSGFPRSGSAAFWTQPLPRSEKLTKNPLRIFKEWLLTAARISQYNQGCLAQKPSNFICKRVAFGVNPAEGSALFGL